jgi:predicted phosphoribosyltransferase
MVMHRQFADRTSAGRELAAKLEHLRGRNAIVLGLPRGGLPVAYEVARALGAPLDILNVRKLGVPWHEELAMGAIGTGGVRVLNSDIMLGMGITQDALDEATTAQQAELERRERLYRGGRPAPVLAGRTVILVDDGIATGATVRAAIEVVRAQKPESIVLAVPVVQDSVAEDLRRDVHELVAVSTPADLLAIGAWYQSFPQLSDDAVRRTLELARSRRSGGAQTSPCRPSIP